jgi:hypothetical protein
LRTSFSYAVGEFQPEPRDSRGIELLDVLDECAVKALKSN